MQKHKMYKNRTTIKVRETVEGETIETKVNRIVNNKEPINDGAPIIYMERKEGINPDYDVRTDKWDVAIDATDKIAKSKIAKREGTMKKVEDKKSDVNAESTQGTDPAKQA